MAEGKRSDRLQGILKKMMMKEITAVADQFQLPGRIVGFQELDAGNINDTFLIRLKGKEQKIILQRINSRVFQQPTLIMENLGIVVEHVRHRMLQEVDSPGRKWESIRFFPSKKAERFVIDAEGAFWRAISFIEDAKAYERIKDNRHAMEAGRALGRFHSLVSDLDPQKLHDTLPGFHITPDYIEQYDEIGSKFANLKKSHETAYCARFVESSRKWAPVLEEAKRKNMLVLRTIHGDPKVSNIMIDEESGRAISIIDLDTVKPGLIHYDIGDCLRSCCNTLGEETLEYDKVHFDLGLCRAILGGYFNEAREFLSDNDYLYIYDAVRLLAFELGLRFFTDYLAGNVYFKANHSQHNLARAVVQFKLTESIEAHEIEIRNLITERRSIKE